MAAADVAMPISSNNSSTRSEVAALELASHRALAAQTLSAACPSASWRHARALHEMSRFSMPGAQRDCPCSCLLVHVSCSGINSLLPSNLSISTAMSSYFTRVMLSAVRRHQQSPRQCCVETPSVVRTSPMILAFFLPVLAGRPLSYHDASRVSRPCRVVHPCSST